MGCGVDIGDLALYFFPVPDGLDMVFPLPPGDGTSFQPFLPAKAHGVMYPN